MVCIQCPSSSLLTDENDDSRFSINFFSHGDQLTFHFFILGCCTCEPSEHHIPFIIQFSNIMYGSFSADDPLPESIALEVKKVIQETNQSNPSVNSLGSTGSNLYVCTDYMAPQHYDNDTSISLCCSIHKESKLDEFCFSYTK